jgi:hypothetical protein
MKTFYQVLYLSNINRSENTFIVNLNIHQYLKTVIIYRLINEHFLPKSQVIFSVFINSGSVDRNLNSKILRLKKNLLGELLSSTSIADIRKKEEKESSGFSKVAEPILKYMDKAQKEDLVDQLTEEMHKAAKDLEFEKAANLRDEIHKLKKMIG